MLAAPFTAEAAVSFAAVRRTASLVTGVNAVFLYVADLDRSMTFYREVLEIPLEPHPHNPDWAEHTFPTGVRFALHRAASPEAIRGSGSMKLDLEVADLDDAIERCAAAGVQVRDVERDFWGSVCTITDPDGYAIDLFQRPRS